MIDDELDPNYCPAEWTRHACILDDAHEGEHRCSCDAQLAPV